MRFDILLNTFLAGLAIKVVSVNVNLSIGILLGAFLMALEVVVSSKNFNDKN